MSTPIHGLAAKQYVQPALRIGGLLALLSTALPGRALGSHQGGSI